MGNANASGGDGIELVVTGGDRVAEVALRLREAGNGGLRRELARAMRAGARPLVAVARDEARETLPRRGGLADQVAAGRFSVSVRTSARGAGVRIIGQSPFDLSAMNRGRLRHPVFGNRSRWVTQSIRPHWFDGERMQSAAQAIRPALLRAVDDVARQVER